MTRRKGLSAVVAASAVMQVVWFAAGVRMDDSALHPANFLQVQWQLLPLNLLRHDLLRSVWNLHSQPPLYNLYCGLLLHLPAGLRSPAAAAVAAALGLVLAATTYLLMVELGVGVKAAVALTVVVVADPALILYQEWLSWSYPSAVGLTAGGFALARSARTGSARWAAAGLSCFAAVLLIDTTFQWPWLVAAAAVAVAAAGRRGRRAVLAAVAVPVLVVGGWYAKTAVQFGTATTSSWLGMNLYQTTLDHAPPAQVARLVAEGTLTPLAEVAPFASVATYSPRFTRSHPTGVPALDQVSGPEGVPNFNNSVYVAVSAKYLADDLAYLRARPGRYARSVGRAVRLWSVPADQYLWSGADHARMGGYPRLFDAVVLLQARSAVQRLDLAAQSSGAGPGAGQVSWTVVALTVVDLLGAPVVMWRRRADRAWLAGAGVLWLTVAYSFAVTSLTEAAENMRFRFELGALPVVLAAVVVASTRICNSYE